MSIRYPKSGVAVVSLAIALSATSWADQSGNATLAADTSLNLDTGDLSTDVSASGGDILWNGMSLTPQGRAGLYSSGKSGSRVFKLVPARYASEAPYSAAPIPASALMAGAVFGVHTNGGHYAKVIVIASGGGSLSVQYRTFGAPGSVASKPAAAGAAPVIAQLQNNYSLLQPGVPNYGIAPGSLFLIYGTGLSSSAPPVLQSSSGPGLPIKLNQTSISVTVNGVVTTPALYYTSDIQLAAVLPSATPVGNGTITVTYNGTASAPAAIQVVPSALGLDTGLGTGTGSGIASDAKGNVFGFTYSAMPGEEIVLWGSGVGADTANDDRTFPQKQDNLTNIPMQVYIGGISANVLYRGRSQYPGVDQINVTIPANVTPGCYVSVVAQSGSIVSNTVTLAVHPTGGTCSDTALGLNGTDLQKLASNGNTPVNAGLLTVAQFNYPAGGGASVEAIAGFSPLDSSLFGAGYSYVSQGSCSLTAPGFNFKHVGLTGGLDAGTIKVSGPGGIQNLVEQGPGGGLYAAQLPALTPGTYTFSSTGGADVKAFNVPLNVPAPFAVTNLAALATITRSQGATVTWSDGPPNGDVLVTGLSGSPAGTVAFYCYAPSSAGQLTIPASTLLALPPTSDKLTIMSFTAPQTIPGMSFSLVTAEVSYTIPYTLK